MRFFSVWWKGSGIHTLGLELRSIDRPVFITPGEDGGNAACEASGVGGVIVGRGGEWKEWKHPGFGRPCARAGAMSCVAITNYKSSTPDFGPDSGMAGRPPAQKIE